MQAKAWIHILIVDDHPLARRALFDVLGMPPDFAVVGSAVSGEMVLTMYAALRPDVVVMDRQMPGMGGVAATRQLKAQYPDARVVMLTSALDADLVLEAKHAGVWCVMAKGVSAAALIAAVRDAAAP